MEDPQIHIQIPNTRRLYKLVRKSFAAHVLQTNKDRRARAADRQESFANPHINTGGHVANSAYPRVSQFFQKAKTHRVL